MGEEDQAVHLSWRQLASAIFQGVLAGGLLAGAFAGGFFYNASVTRATQSSTSFALVSEADGLLAQNFLYNLPDDAIRVHGAVSGLVATLNDPYTFFVEPQTAAVDSQDLAGRFGGIGAEITRDAQGNFVISRIYPDNPAAEAGLLEGDIITAADGVQMDTTSSDMNQLLSAVRGEIGSKVTLTIRRGDSTFDVTLTRAEVLVPAAFWHVLDEDKRIGYIQLTRFTDHAPDEIGQAIQELDAQGVTAYVLDLRDNGGGLVDSSVEIAGDFLSGGVVLYEERKGQAEKVYNASAGGPATDVPLVVLVNHGTASASEILAGALHDRGRATLIGEQTYGKGVVQVILELSDGSSLHVTTAQWFTPDHDPIQDNGLTPDIAVTPVEGQDAPLAAAVDFLRKQMKTSARPATPAISQVS